MKVVIISGEGKDYSRKVTDFAREFKRRNGREVEIVSPYTMDGERMARAYGIVEYPTILALKDDGGFVQMWRGEALPTIDEVTGYLI
jgi:hypothetical protein